MKRVELYVNSLKEKAKKLSEIISRELVKNGYEIVRDKPDIIIGFGGDGTLLNLLHEKKYNINAMYIGINCGTLGFLQEFEVIDVAEFVKNIPNYIQQKIYFLEIEVINGKERKIFNALNEFNVQSSNDKSFRTRVEIQNEVLEDYIGTGLIFSSPTGSTAQNLSAGGSIIYPELEVIQITPREAIVNKEMHCLSKSICIPSNISISLIPNNDDEIKIYSDGIATYIGKYERINIYYSNSNITKLTDKQNSFVRKIREKLI